MQQKANIDKGHDKAPNEFAAETQEQKNQTQPWHLCQKEEARTVTSFLHYATSRLSNC